MCVFRLFLGFFVFLFPFGASKEDNAKRKPQRRCCGFFVRSEEGLAGPRLQTGESEKHDGRREDGFVLIGGFSGASGREKLSRVSKGHLQLASCFQRKE